MVNSVDTP